MPPKKGGKKGASGYKMAPKLPNGTVLQDVSKKKWILTGTVGSGGFGLIYFAEEQGEKGRKCVVKIEPHENGPLFVEWHYYLAAGRPEHLKAWSGPAHLPALWGYGSHTVGDEKLRFIVIDKLGADLDKTFKGGENPLSLPTIANIAIQVLHSLEYIHSKGYTHNDVKAANLLSHADNPKNLYLVDFGLAVKYMKGEENAHKEEKPDPRKAHDGTIEYLSRDAHLGCTARRSDLENLALNLVHWSQGSLPWQSLVSKTMKPADLVKVQAAKIEFFDNLPSTGKGLSKQVLEFLQYTAGLHFDQSPDYKHCRNIFSKVSSKELALNSLDEAPKKQKKVEGAKKGAGKRKAKEVDEVDTERQEKSEDLNGVDLVKSPALRNGDSVVEDEKNSPQPAKRGRKTANPKVAKIEKNGSNAQEAAALGRRTRNGKGGLVDPSSEEEDMFAASPSPVRNVQSREFKETGCQVSPAFVAAGKEARRKEKMSLAGTKRENWTPAMMEVEKKKENLTPAMMEVEKKKEKRGKMSSKAAEEERNGAVVEENAMDNPTPAMMAIMQKRQEAEKAGVKLTGRKPKQTKKL